MAIFCCASIVVVVVLAGLLAGLLPPLFEAAPNRNATNVVDAITGKTHHAICFQYY